MTTTEGVSVAWTTLPSREEAERIAASAVDAGLVACAQVDGPIRSFYTWEGVTQNEEEFRIHFKFPSSKSRDLEAWIHAQHPYAVPEWMVLPVEQISPSYRAWVLGVR
jgi:periplasmic divalent cation tolerance protein